MLNRGSLGQLGAIRSILLKKTIAQLASPTTTILRVTPLRKGSVLKAEISSSSLFANNLIDDLVINQLAKFASFKSCVSHVNSPARKKSTKARQKIACNVALDRVEASNVDKTFNRTSRILPRQRIQTEPALGRAS